MPYWTVKLNGQVIYDSNNDEKKPRLHLYAISIKDIQLTDTLEVEYFTDTPCFDCIHNYFITEFTDIEGEAYAPLGTYLKEQKYFGPKAYKIALTDILNCGTKKTIKSVYFYTSIERPPLELCRINFK
jgi:hypothetical protein